VELVQKLGVGRLKKPPLVILSAAKNLRDGDTTRVIAESMKYWTVLDVTPSATMGLYQRRAEILRSAQNDKHFLLSLVTGSRGVD